MRILQLIDSFEIGGAEKMAVNFANALNNEIDFSGIVVTRKQGKLFENVENKNNYLFLKKESTLDFKAVFKLKNYCKTHKINYIQAHGTSFFTAFLLKIVHPKINVIFHDHNGARSNQKIKDNFFLWIASFFFKAIIVVNHSLKDWVLKNLNCKNVIYLPNFTTLNDSLPAKTILKGKSHSRILCLANLRDPKNHKMLLDIAIKVNEKYANWTFHLVGKNNNDDYSNSILETIKHHNLQEVVYVYGQKDDIAAIINQSDICVLTSSSEGLPVAILEYGLLKKPVVSTNVGEIPLLIKNNQSGFIVDIFNSEDFYKSVSKLIENSALRIKFGEELFKTISESNSKEAVISNYLNWLKLL